ncbi:MAG: nucleotidyltransferase domain-containing protein [Candidatus Thiodiazotropha sp.]
MRRWAEKAVDIIVDLYDPDQIVLFGSSAKGKETTSSDIDMIVVKDTGIRRAHRGVEVYEALSRFPVKFDLLFYTHEELKDGLSRPYSFLESVWKTATCLYRKT